MKYVDHSGDAGRQVVPQDFSNLSDASLQMSKAMAAMVYAAMGWVDESGNELRDYHYEGGSLTFVKTCAVALDLKVVGKSNTSSQGSKEYPIYDGHRGEGCILWDWKLFTFKKCADSAVEPKHLVFMDLAIDPKNLYNVENQAVVQVHHEYVCQQMTTEELRAMTPGSVIGDIDLDDKNKLYWIPNLASVAFVDSKVGKYFKPVNPQA